MGGNGDGDEGGGPAPRSGPFMSGDGGRFAPPDASAEGSIGGPANADAGSMGVAPIFCRLEWKGEGAAQTVVVVVVVANRVAVANIE